MEKEKKRANGRKSEEIYTFLGHKNQFPFFFLCAKYGPEVNTTSREHSFSRQGESRPLKIENF